MQQHLEINLTKVFLNKKKRITVAIAARNTTAWIVENLMLLKYLLVSETKSRKVFLICLDGRMEELVNMIETQRAYEINSKSISSADQMLQFITQNIG